MKKMSLLLLSLNFLCSLWFNNTSLLAETSGQKTTIVEIPPDSTLSCDQAIENVKAYLIRRGFFKAYTGPGSTPGNRQPQVRFDQNSIPRAYKNYPTDRTVKVSFDAVSATNLYHSPKLMATLAAQVMGECNQVGIVYFQDYEGGQPIGYFPDRTARTFVWTQILVRHNPQGMLESVPFDWGYYYDP